MEGSVPTGNLAKIEHVVVLMLENRSFDHMLGYLSLEGGRSDIDGLREGMSNSYGKRDYPIHRLEQTKVPGEKWDPDHSAKATDHQIGGGAMAGFAASYGETLKGREVADPDPGLVMGYFGAEQVPVYDHLAAHFCVCDTWHSSVPGATWPNRLYAVAGQADGIATTAPTTSRRSTTGPPSSATSTPPGSTGAGTPTTSAACGPSTSAGTDSVTTSISAGSTG